jgi:chromosome segregation ATPase
MSATEDLLYIAQRVKGITDLIPLLQEIESLDNYKIELDRQIEAKKSEIDKLEEFRMMSINQTEELQKSSNMLEKQIDQANSKHAAILKSIENLKSKF